MCMVTFPTDVRFSYKEHSPRSSTGNVVSRVWSVEEKQGQIIIWERTPSYLTSKFSWGDCNKSRKHVNNICTS
jgi:cell wall assembly regulator SMI1